MKIQITRRFRAAALAAALFLAPAGALASPELLPADTVLAFGLEGVAGHQDKFQPFIDEFMRLGLGDSLARVFADEGLDAGDLGDAQDALDFVAQAGLAGLVTEYGWAGLNVSISNPVPNLTLILTPDAAARAEIADELASAESSPGALTLMEGSQPFVSLPLDGAMTLNVALTDAHFVLSTNPDVLRGVLRREAGSSEPSLVSSPGWTATSAHVGRGNLHFYLDVAAGMNVLHPFLRPFAGEFGVAGLLDELVTAIATTGTIASSSVFTDSGTATESVQVVQGDSAAVRSLILDRGAVSRDGLVFVPADSLNVAVGTSSAVGWWDYLNGVFARNPELGITSLDDLLRMFFGVDLRTNLFSWLGDEITTVTVGMGDLAQPGVASDNLLGESLFIMRTTDDAAASTGLETLLTTLGSTIGMFMSLDGSGPAAAGAQTETVQGVTVSTMDIGSGIVLSWAVTDGFVLFSTDGTSVAAALEARAAAAPLGTRLEAMLANVPEGAVGFNVSDDGATVASTAEQLALQLQLTAGLMGGDIDFDALDDATRGLTEFLNFVAARLGGSYSYSHIEGDTIITVGASEIDW